MAHTYRNHKFHLVWSTKERVKVISPVFQQRLYKYMCGVAINEGHYILAIGGMSDHIHVLLSMDNLEKHPSFIRLLKSRSSAFINKEKFLPYKFAWQEGYGSFSVSYSQVPIVEKYIQNQEKHHKTRTYENEYIGLLDKHGVQYDPKNVFS